MNSAHQTEVDKNYEVFLKELPRLMQEHAGRHALMKEGKIVMILDTCRDADTVGHEKFGLEPFSIQEITTTPHNQFPNPPAPTRGQIFLQIVRPELKAA